MLGVRPEHHEDSISEHDASNEQLFVVVSVREEEAEGTEFQAGFYRAAIAPHHAMRHCGIGFSDLLGRAPES